MRLSVAVLAAVGALAGRATAQSPPTVVAPEGATPTPIPRAEGYLAAAEIPDTFRILPPAPHAGSAAKAEDIAAFRETRKLVGTPRWALATSDAREAGIVEDMTCALGVRLTPANAPHLFHMIPRLGRDAGRSTTSPKEQYKQIRPFLYLGDRDAICTEADRDGLRKSYSYPSGHTTWAWTVGLILAEAAPDKATPILARARAFGESRVVCGVHWASDVTEGRVNGAILVSALHAKPEFAADLAETKLEIAAARVAQGTVAAGDPGVCAIEAEASAHTPWTR